MNPTNTQTPSTPTPQWKQWAISNRMTVIIVTSIVALAAIVIVLASKKK